MPDIDMKSLPPQVAAYIRSLEEANQAKEKELQIKNEELMKLQSLNEQLVNLRRKMFGQSSEKAQYVDKDQLSLIPDFFNEAETYSDASAPEPGKTTEVKAHTRKAKRTKKELTEGLEHRKIVCEAEGTEKVCARCGNEMTRIGEKFIRSDLVIVPAQVYVVDYYAASYKCSSCEKDTGESYIIQGRVPKPVMKKSMASPATVAYVIQEKYQNGVPLYRQEKYWKDQGIMLQRNTLANWVIRSSRWFEPLRDRMQKEMIKSDIVHADETDLHVLKEDGRETKQISKMWVFYAPEKKIALYQYKPSRSGTVAKEMLNGFRGYLQTDGYTAYNAVENVTRVGCYAHARRKWIECFVDKKPVKGSASEKAYLIMEKVFKLEKRWKDLPLEERYKKRKAELRPVMDEYWHHLNSFEAEKDTALYRAQQYSLNQKQYLENIFLDGRLDLTNNACERLVKPFVMARKNFLFSDTAKGADASALCMSIIETAKKNNLNPYGYILYLLQELPQIGEKPTDEQLEPFLPWSPSIPDFCRVHSSN